MGKEPPLSVNERHFWRLTGGRPVPLQRWGRIAAGSIAGWPDARSVDNAAATYRDERQGKDNSQQRRVDHAPCMRTRDRIEHVDRAE